MLFREYALMDGLDIAEAVRKKDISAAEAVDAAILAIERLDPEINAVTLRMFEGARDVAAGHLSEGPFSGVPILLKDIAAGTCAGTPCTMGSSLLSRNISDHDCEVVARYKSSGTIILGKTNLPNFGTNGTTEPRSFGPTRNPWDLTRSAGGSSGGSAAAVASGMVPIAHGTDAAGSLRVPASHCGVFTLKPTRGRISAGPDAGEFVGGLGTVHVLTRSVRDCAAMLDATSGYVTGDPYIAPAPTEAFLTSAERDPSRLRIAFSAAAPNGAAVDQECVAAVRSAAQLCHDLGHHVEEASPVFDFRLMSEAFVLLHSAHWGGQANGLLGSLGRAPEPHELEASVIAWARVGAERSAIDYGRAQRSINGISRAIGYFFESYDVFISPCSSEPPLPLGVLDAMEPMFDRFLESMWSNMAFTAQFNCTGQPAMSVPLHWTSDGLPVGVQFAGRFGQENTLLSLAGQLERARPWAARRPTFKGSKHIGG